MANPVLDKIGGWFSRAADAYVLAPLPPERGGATPLKAYQPYLQVTLCEMFLAKRVSWLRTWFPAVHAEVRMPFADQPSVTFSRVVRPADDALGEGVLLNYPLTELVPFSGGTVEIDAALFGLKAQDNLAAGVALLQTFSSLVAPPLGQALNVAGTLATGARDFLAKADGDVHLALHQSLTSEGGAGGNLLQPGYLAVVLAPEQVVESKRLRVSGDRLHRLAADGESLEPFTSHDFMLLRIDGRTERDNWRSPEILDARQRAIDALRRGDKDTATEQRGVALAAVLTSWDLTAADQRRLVHSIKQEWRELSELGLGATSPNPPKDLAGLLARYPMPRSTAAALGPLTAAEAFGA
jgi:hypothetical protein